MDVMVKLEGHKVSTDVYSKPTDTRQYLGSGSCHPRRVKQAAPYREALRVRRICDSEEVCDERLKELSGDFIKKSFKRKFVESIFENQKEE